MEQEQAKSQLAPFKVVWHPGTYDDLKDIHPDHADTILNGVAHKLSKAPHLLGTPIKGTMSLLWKVKFSKYRVVFTINKLVREVVVLHVGKRDDVYHRDNIESLLKLALALGVHERK